MPAPSKRLPSGRSDDHRSGPPRGPALTVDAVWIDRGRLLLVRRGRPPFQGRWALPGGFVELDETVEAAVVRELEEETGLRAHPRSIVGVYSGPHRDPRGSTTTVAFRMAGRAAPPRGGDDAALAAWVPIAEARGLAFDHDLIVRDALRALRRFTRHSTSGSELRTRGSGRDAFR